MLNDGWKDCEKYTGGNTAMNPRWLYKTTNDFETMYRRVGSVADVPGNEFIPLFDIDKLVSFVKPVAPPKPTVSFDDLLGDEVSV